jgi:hypothetical protein
MRFSRYLIAEYLDSRLIRKEKATPTVIPARIAFSFASFYFDAKLVQLTNYDIINTSEGSKKTNYIGWL